MRSSAHLTRSRSGRGESYLYNATGARADAKRECRACVGRNLASLELQIIAASILRRFHFVLEKPEEPVSTFTLLPCPICYTLEAEIPRCSGAVSDHSAVSEAHPCAI